MPENDQPSIGQQPVTQFSSAADDEAATLSRLQTTQQAKDAYHRGDWTEAERLCRWILSDQPQHFEALNVLGIIAAQTQRPLEAIDLFSRAIMAAPSHANAYGNLGNVLHDLKRHEEALECFNRALKINPDDSETLYNRSGVLGALRRYVEALEGYDHALQIKPDHVEALINRGVVLRGLSRLEEALASYDRALRINPDLAEALCNRGLVLSDLNRHAAALESYGQALKTKPDYVEAHVNLSMHLLRLGGFARGWDEYEWRWQMTKYRDARIAINAPTWNGQKVLGSLLVWNEHGLGDEIFFAGMLNDLAPYVPSITICVDPRLIPLFQRSFDNMQVISRQMLKPDARFDAHIPMGSLGRYLRRSFNEFPDRTKPYLRACENRSRNLRVNNLNHRKLTCGLSWFSKSPDTGMDKSLRLQDLEPLLTLPGIDFVDLQYGDTTQEQAALHAATGLSLKRVTEIDNFNDIDGLAALIEACDIVVTVSNTTAHLAGALGKPVLLMLPFSRGLLWYWHMERLGNPWYPTVTLFRQPVIGDWRRVIERVGEALGRYRIAESAITEVRGDR